MYLVIHYTACVKMWDRQSPWKWSLMLLKAVASLVCIHLQILHPLCVRRRARHWNITGNTKRSWNSPSKIQTPVGLRVQKLQRHRIWSYLILVGKTIYEWLKLQTNHQPRYQQQGLLSDFRACRGRQAAHVSHLLILLHLRKESMI